MKKLLLSLLAFSGVAVWLRGMGLSWLVAFSIAALSALFYFLLYTKNYRPDFLLFLNLSLLLQLNRLDPWDLQLRSLLLFVLIFSVWLAFRLPLYLRLDFKKAFTAALVVYLAAAAAFTLKGRYLSGDEPHYLLITHSLLHDGDIYVRDNYERQDYKLYHPVKLEPHIYGNRKLAFHMPGPSAALLPFYFLAEHFPGRLTRVFIFRAGMAFYSALFAALLFLFLSKREGAGPAWLVVALLPPFLFMSFHIYPEPFAALILLASFLLRKKPLLAGAALALLPWFSVKFLTLMVLALFWLMLIERRFCAKLLVFPALSLLFFELFLYLHFHSFSPSAFIATPSAAFLKVPLSHRVKCLFGYFLDQRDGLLPYAPFYLLALVGFFRFSAEERRRILPHLLLFGAYVLFYALTAHRGAYSPFARPLVPVLWLAALPIASVMEKKSLAEGMLRFLAGVSLFLAFLIFLYPSFLYQPATLDVRTRAGALFQFLSSPVVNLPSLLPSFLKALPALTAANLIWLAVLAFAVLILVHDIRRPASGWFLAASSLLGLFLLFFPLIQVQREIKAGPYKLFSLSRRVLVQGGKLTFLRNGRYFLNFVDDKPLEKVELSLKVERGLWKVKCGPRRLQVKDRAFLRAKPWCWCWRKCYCRLIMEVRRGEGASPLVLSFK